MQAKISTQRRSQWSGCPTTSSVEDVPNVFGWPPSDSKRNSRQMVDGSCPKILGDPTITLFLFHSFHWFDGNFGANVDIFMWGLILKHVLCFSVLSTWSDQDPDWRVRLKNFDSIFAPCSANEKPKPKAGDEDIDLGQQETEVTVTPTKGAEPCPTPPSMSQQEFEEKHKTVDATITLTVGTSITCYVVGGKLFLTSPSKVMLPGVQAENAKPLLMYAGGVGSQSQQKQLSSNTNQYFSFFWFWRQDKSTGQQSAAQAQEFLSKAANENKAIEFLLESENAMVP